MDPEDFIAPASSDRPIPLVPMPPEPVSALVELADIPSLLPSELPSMVPSALPSTIASALPEPAELTDVSALVSSDVPSGLESKDSPSPRTLEMLAGCDPRDARFETPDDPRIPASQMYFKIGEVSQITGIKPYVLRYWELEFPWIRPEKTSSRQRRYRRQDLALLFRISRLRYAEHLTIEETRQQIREDRQKEKGGRDKGSKGPRGSARRAASVMPAKTELSEGTTTEVPRIESLAALAQLPRSPELVRALAEMRTTVLELLEAVEE
ncbi:MerR family transcriptional regulator [Myxococcota bacterium]|nr:MerR family transcriptional regulator [Myxococcota bacterium]